MDDCDHLAQLELKSRYHSSLPAKAAELEEKWHAVTAGQFSPSAMTELTLYVHQLAGSTGMYGYDQLAQLARDLEGHLREPGAAADRWRQEISAGVEALVKALLETQSKISK